jgi:hypothetical protein
MPHGLHPGVVLPSMPALLPSEPSLSGPSDVPPASVPPILSSPVGITHSAPRRSGHTSKPSEHLTASLNLPYVSPVQKAVLDSLDSAACR